MRITVSIIENRMVTQWNTSTSTSELYSYGPDNQRVWKRTTAGSEQVTFYGLRGERLDMYQPISSTSGVLNGGADQLYFAGRPVNYGADRWDRSGRTRRTRRGRRS